MKNKKNMMYIIIIILVTIIILSKLFLNIRYNGHDTIFHVTNIIKLSETISFDNIFGSNIITYEFNKFGYGIWLFYPKLPHLLAAYTHLIVKDIYLSMEIIYFITTVLSGIFMYYLSKKIFNNNNIALLSSIIYITAPYHVCEIYIRDAFAENFMFLVLPMIFLGLYNLKDGNYFKFYIWFILGYIIGMNSHLGSMFFYTIFIGLFILYYRKDFFKKDKFMSLVISALIVTGITLPFLTTLMEHKILGLYRVFTESFSNLAEVQIFSLNLKDLFMQKPLFDDVMPYFNITTLVLFFVTFLSFIFNKNDDYKKDKKIFLLFIVLLVNIVCSKVIWEYVPSLFISIQFPWRLLVFLTLFVSLFSPLILINKKIPFRLKNILIVILILLVIFEGINNITYYSDFEVSVDESMSSIYSMGYQREYFPVITAEDLYIFHYDGYNHEIKDYEITTDDDIYIEIIKDEFPNMEFVVDNLTEDTIIEFPRIYYLGYELVDEDNEEISVYNNPYGMLEASINKNGIYKLNYVRTSLRKLAEVVRLFTALIVMGVLVVKFIRWKKRRLQF